MPLPVVIKIKEESRKFIKKILPAIKGRRSYATGLIEAIVHGFLDIHF